MKARYRRSQFLERNPLMLSQLSCQIVLSKEGVVPTGIEEEV